MLIAGFALFKLQDEGILKSPEKLFNHFEKAESAKKMYGEKLNSKEENVEFRALKGIRKSNERCLW